MSFRTSTPANFTTVPTINYLPDEILGRIFYLVSCASTLCQASRRDLLSVTYVCRRWRHLALALGELWMHLSILFPITEQELLRAKEWVSRSNPYPLTIIIDIRDPDWDFNEESHLVTRFEMQATMGVILPVAERWRSVNILADNWEPLHVFLHHTQNILVPILRNLRLVRCNPYFAAPSQVFVPSNLRAPYSLLGGVSSDELTSIELEGVHVDWASPALHNLTKLSLGYHARDVIPTLGQFRDLLHSSPKLESFSLIGWGPQLDEASVSSIELQESRGSIRLPQLTSLEVGVMIPSYTVEVLSLFMIPRLESLTIDDVTRYDPQTSTRPDLGPIFNFLAGQTSSFHPLSIATEHLTSLAIMNLDPGEIPFSAFLHSLQCLRVLHIRNCTTSVFSGLAPDSAGSTACHSLRQLCVDGCDPNALADVISSRKLGTVSYDMAVNLLLDTEDPTSALSTETATRLQELNISVTPLVPSKNRQWKSYEFDDSEALVSAILEERWDVAGTVIQ